MTIDDAVELCDRLRPHIAIPVHYEGWSHFREGRDVIERRLTTGPDGHPGRVSLPPLRDGHRHRGLTRRARAARQRAVARARVASIADGARIASSTITAAPTMPAESPSPAGTMRSRPVASGSDRR